MNEKTIETWNSLSQYWDNRMGDEGDWYYKNIVYPAIFKLIGDLNDLKILDVGCSTSCLSRSLAKRGAIVIGIDSSPEMLKFALDRENNTPLNIRYYCIDIKKLSNHLKEKFNFIITNFTLQDVEDFESILKELRRYILANGKLIISLEHPVIGIFNELHVTTKREWIDCNKKSKNYLDIFSRYKKCKKVKIFWKKDLSSITFYRTFEEYTNALYNSNFVISRILEPTISKSQAMKGPKNNLSSKLPMFIIIEAIPLPTK